MEDTRLPKCLIFGELVRGAGCVGGQGKESMRCFLDDRSPGRGGMAQNGGTRGGAFHGEIDRCRDSQGWTTACSGMSERDWKDQE